MKYLASVVGFGFGNVLLPFPITYLILSKAFNIKISNLKIVALLFIAALLNGATQEIFLAGIKSDNISWLILSAFVIPVSVSAVVIGSGYKLFSR